MRALHVVTGVSVVIAFAAANLPSTFAQAPSGAWLTDYNQAAQLAAQQGRPLVVHFGATWCGPCQKMEGETLRSPELRRMIQDGFVAVKVDLGRNPEMGEQFGIESMPTDIFFAPDGTELSRTVGYQSKVSYIGTMSRIDARYAQARQAQANAISVAGPRAPTTASASLPREKKVPMPTEDPGVAPGVAIPRPAPQLAAKVEEPKGSAGPAIDGYCPVTLRNTRAWKKGRSEFSLDYDGQTYYFQGSSELSSFKANPGRYSPKLLGCDPVVLSETDLLAPGTTKFGAFFDGELYLFKSAETRSRFKNDPLRYSRMRHVLKPGDLQKRRA